MNDNDAYEQAYKNGYEDGMRAQYEKIIRCRDCARYNDKQRICIGLTCERPVHRKPEDFCGYAVKKNS